jgi:hypothetical protein
MTLVGNHQVLFCLDIISYQCRVLEVSISRLSLTDIAFLCSYQAPW